MKRSLLLLVFISLLGLFALAAASPVEAAKPRLDRVMACSQMGYHNNVIYLITSKTRTVNVFLGKKRLHKVGGYRSASKGRTSFFSWGKKKKTTVRNVKVVLKGKNQTRVVHRKRIKAIHCGGG
jgi:hypothetical protein